MQLNSIAYIETLCTFHILKKFKLNLLDNMKYLSVFFIFFFMGSICKSIGLEPGYYDTSVRRGGFMFLSGSDNDIVGMWPPIRGTRKEFPLMD